MNELELNYLECTLISLINVEVGINVEGVQKLANHYTWSTRLLTNFEKFHPIKIKNPPSTPRLLQLCTSFFQKIPPSCDLAAFAPPPRLFQPPRLLKR